MDSSRPAILDLDPAELSRIVRGAGGEPYRERQILEWIFARFAHSFGEMTNLPRALREALEKDLLAVGLHIHEKQEAEGGWAKKYLWGKDSKPLVESVLMSYRYGLSGCVSTQVGCPVGCAFCASKELGFTRNLTRAEIVEQFLGMCRDVGERVGHLVFMGTGEPFLNYDNVLGAIEVLSDPALYGLSRRKMTVSTVGIPDGIRRFKDDSGGVRLTLSLHAPSDAQRDKIIPMNKRHPLGQVIPALAGYTRDTGQRVTLAYTLLGGVNDRESDALALSALARGLPCLVNLVPYNPVPGLPWVRPDPQVVLAFQETLRRNRVKVTLRRKLGVGIEAACGQLGRRRK